MVKYTIVETGLLLDNNLNNSAKVLYMTLGALAEELNYVKISEKVLGEKLDISDRSIRKSLKDLEEYGLIAKYRDGFRAVQMYVVIPYEIRRQVVLETEEELEALINEVGEYFEGELKRDKTVDRYRQLNKKEEYTSRDYCKYFAEKLMETKGLAIKWGGSKTMSIMKRVTKDKSIEENLKLIDVFILMYDLKFKKAGFEYPTIEGFGTTWIYNKVVEMSKHTNIGKKKDSLDHTIVDIAF